MTTQPIEPAPATNGANALHLWFGLSYASFLTLPRSFLQAMPDDWQGRMAELLNEWDAHWDAANYPEEKLVVCAQIDNKFTQMPRCLKDYRRWYPDKINTNFANKHIEKEHHK